MIPFPLRSFHQKDIPIFSFHFHPCGCGSPSWFISHSSIPCTRFHPWCDSMWVHILGMIQSYLIIDIQRLYDWTIWRNWFVMFLVFSLSCSWIQATVDFISRRIHVLSTRTRDNVHSMPYFIQWDTFVHLWDHQLVYGELHVLVSLQLSLTLYSHPTPYSFYKFVNQEWVGLWRSHQPYYTVS